MSQTYFTLLGRLARSSTEVRAYTASPHDGSDLEEVTEGDVLDDMTADLDTFNLPTQVCNFICIEFAGDSLGIPCVFLVTLMYYW